MIVDVPLLIEAGMWKWVGDTVVVYVYVLDDRSLTLTWKPLLTGVCIAMSVSSCRASSVANLILL